jgi:hypothetical protein
MADRFRLVPSGQIRQKYENLRLSSVSMAMELVLQSPNRSWLNNGNFFSMALLY